MINYTSGNFRSAQSNAFFIRNTAQGRALVIDWLAIVMSGYIQCHGFDQVIGPFDIKFCLILKIIDTFILCYL